MKRRWKRWAVLKRKPKWGEEGKYSSRLRKEESAFCKPVPPHISTQKTWHEDQGENSGYRVPSPSKTPLLTSGKEASEPQDHERSCELRQWDDWCGRQGSQRQLPHPLSLQDLCIPSISEAPVVTGNESLPSSQQDAWLETKSKLSKRK